MKATKHDAYSTRVWLATEAGIPTLKGRTTSWSVTYSWPTMAVEIPKMRAFGHKIRGMKFREDGMVTAYLSR